VHGSSEPLEVAIEMVLPALETAVSGTYNRCVESGALEVPQISAPDSGKIQDGLAAEKRRFLNLGRVLVVESTARSRARDF
jgi:hypothetical protein